MSDLLVEALRAGIPILDFWDLTPCETVRAIRVIYWRMDQDLQAKLAQAWHTANLMRAKRLPTLKRFITPPKPLTPEYLKERRREFSEMAAVWNKEHGE